MVKMIGTADSGDSGDSGVSGDSGASGDVGAAVGLVRKGRIRPIGISPRVKKYKNEDFWRGNEWPPADLGGEWGYVNFNKKYRKTAWSLYYRSVAALAEFVSDREQRWNHIHLEPYPSDPKEVCRELKELEELIEYRGSVMTEALA